jgi:hypothetical protein
MDLDPPAINSELLELVARQVPVQISLPSWPPFAPETYPDLGQGIYTAHAPMQQWAAPNAGDSIQSGVGSFQQWHGGHIQSSAMAGNRMESQPGYQLHAGVSAGDRMESQPGYQLHARVSAGGVVPPSDAAQLRQFVGRQLQPDDQQGGSSRGIASAATIGSSKRLGTSKLSGGAVAGAAVRAHVKRDYKVR